jgi:hypothetical protein
MKDYGGLIMPSVASVKKDLEALGKQHRKKY